MQISLSEPTLIPAVFVLAVFLIALLTNGYFYGIISSLVSVLAVNFAFTFPLFEFNFTIRENAVSAVIMIAVTTITCALTAKLKYQDALKAENDKEKMRGNLLRAISHDLRTPLTSIYGSASTISENYSSLSDSDKLTMLKSIKEDSQWLIRMVENLLSVTRFDNKNMTLVKSSIVLEELIDSTLSKFNNRYPDIKVDLDMPDDFITVSVDPILIEQVLMNILENSVQHAKGMTKISLRIFVMGDNVIFEVKDDGIGIPKENINSLFTSYSPLSTDDTHHNMGIGLNVCASIIKAHSGTITAENAKDGGAIFRFSLKLEEDNEQQV